MSRFTRRQFLETTSAGVAASVPFVFSSAEARADTSPNARPTLAVIGCGGQGTGDGHRALEFGDIVAVCDVDSAHAEGAKHHYKSEVSKKGKEAKIDVYEDYRAIIDRTDIDAIICGTVDHWHVKVSAEALRSGKDAYCEKPLTLTIDEGRVISKVVEETGRILQVGTQQRSDERFLKAVAVAHSGRLGKLKKVTVGINRNPFSKPLPVVDPPKTLNWDRWKGPTEDVPYRFLARGKAGAKVGPSLGRRRRGRVELPQGVSLVVAIQWWQDDGLGCASRRYCALDHSAKRPRSGTHETHSCNGRAVSAV